MARWRCVLSDRSTEWATPTCTKICVNLEEERRGEEERGQEERKREESLSTTGAFRVSRSCSSYER